MKTLLAILALVALAVCGQNLTFTDGAFVGSLGTAVVSSGGTTYLLKQGFEGTGFDNSESWSITETVASNIDADYTTTVLDGTQSFRFATTAETASCTASFTSNAEVWVYGMLRLPSIPAATTRILYLKGGGNDLAQLIIDSAGNLLVRSGSSGSATTTDALSENTTYHVWMHWVKGTGANSTLSVGFATTATEPTSGNKFAEHTGGDAAVNATSIQLGQDGPSTCEWIIDNVRVNNTAIGSNPE